MGEAPEASAVLGLDCNSAASLSLPVDTRRGAAGGFSTVTVALAIEAQHIWRRALLGVSGKGLSPSRAMGYRFFGGRIAV